MSDVLELCQKKKKRHSPDIGIRQVVPVPVSDTDMTPKMACPCNLGTKVTCFEMWHVIYSAEFCVSKLL